MNILFLYFSLIVIAVGCGVAPSGAPGQCALKCSKAKIGDSLGMKVTPINVPEKFICLSEGVFERPVVLSFKVTNSVPGSSYGKKADELVDVPVGGISFLAETSGSIFAIDKSSTENGKFDDTKKIFSPSQYAGIATPMSEWCSDECGILTIQVWPQCPPIGTELNGTLSVRSGSLAPAKLVEISISTPKPTSLTGPGPETGFEKPLQSSTFL